MVVLLAASTSVFASLYSLKVISFAFITTASITILITIIARFIPVDFTKCGTLLCILSIVFLVISIVVTILIIVLRMPILQVGLAGLGVLLISFWMLFDTQRILGGKYELEEDEYLMGAITLFVDIIYIFQYLLIIFGLCASDE
uniref:Uncharacterized protein n=2 Tax=Rhodnius prolixus TaxID=13249 RepID=T1I2Q4_RHOPR